MGRGRRRRRRPFVPGSAGRGRPRALSSPPLTAPPPHRGARRPLPPWFGPQGSRPQPLRAKPCPPPHSLGASAPVPLPLLSSSERRSARRQPRPRRCSPSRTRSEVLRSLRKNPAEPQIGSWPSAPKARCEPLGSRGAACSWGAAPRLAKHPK